MTERNLGRRLLAPLALAAGALLAAAGTSHAQVADTALPKGVQLKLVYEAQYRPRVAVQPFSGEGGAVVGEAHRIIQRDLDYSDRFDLLFAIPEALREGSDYTRWNDLGVVYLVTGGMQRAETGGYLLRLALHDVVYGSVKEIRLFELPELDDDGFRMAVHAASDEVVRWITGEPGIAATRIVLTRHLGDGTYELLMVDSDGENLARVDADLRLYSPKWSPDGQRLAYGRGDEQQNLLVERDLATGRETPITDPQILAQTPAYAPGGEKLALALWIDRGMELYEYDVARNCCLRRLSGNSGRSTIDMHPSYSPDGRRIVFHSDRLGNPHIFTMEASGGRAVLMTPFESETSSFYFGPEWSPRGSQIVFTGRSRGVNQIMYLDAARPGAPVQQITGEGRSEDPSWAPDGRHIVFSGVREDGMGLYVIDLVTGRIRPLVTGGRYRMPDWSPVLVTAAPLAATP